MRSIHLQSIETRDEIRDLMSSELDRLRYQAERQLAKARKLTRQAQELEQELDKA